MRLRIIRKHVAFDLYTVACRYHETIEWISERNHYTEIIYPLSGGFLLRHGSDMLCYPGRLSLVPAAARYQVAHLPRFPDETLVFKLKHLPAAKQHHLANIHSPLHVVLSPRKTFLLQSLATGLMRNDAHSTSADAQLIAIMRRLLEDLLHGGQSHDQAMQPDIRRLERAVRLLATRTHLLKPGKLSASASYSQYHFNRRFREAYGITPHQAVIATRVAQALALMRKGETLSVAARAAGFSHIGHLSSRLRALGGLAPSRLLQLDTPEYSDGAQCRQPRCIGVQASRGVLGHAPSMERSQRSRPAAAARFDPPLRNESSDAMRARVPATSSARVASLQPSSGCMRAAAAATRASRSRGW